VLKPSGHWGLLDINESAMVSVGCVNDSNVLEYRHLLFTQDATSVDCVGLFLFWGFYHLVLCSCFQFVAMVFH